MYLGVFQGWEMPGQLQGFKTPNPEIPQKTKKFTPGPRPWTPQKNKKTEEQCVFSIFWAFFKESGVGARGGNFLLSDPPQWTEFASTKQGFTPTLRLVQNPANSR